MGNPTVTVDIDGVTVTAGLSPDRYGRLVITSLSAHGGPITSYTLRRIPILQIETDANRATEQVQFAGRVPGESPEEFMARFVDAYRALAAWHPHPVVELAKMAEAKVPTVHTWVREARLRGFLPPASRRKGEVA